MIQKSYNNTPSLYLIPTPVGNLEDITIRSLNVLKMVDCVLCEDTRDTGVLINKYGIKQKLLSCHEYNEERMINVVIKLLKEGKNVGLVTDQGTPIISDPGFILTRALINAGYNVIGLPGSTAFVPALIMSGINPSPFIFYGFLNSKSSKQIKELQELKNEKYTIIFYESVHRLKMMLSNLLKVFGDRNIAICREISKVYEEIIRGKVSEIINYVDSLKGEFVIVVDGNKELVDYSELSVIDHVNIYKSEGLSDMDAIKIVAKERNVAKSVIYNEYHTGK